MCWGDGSSGQLGDGTTRGHDVPTRVKSLRGIVQVVTGADHTCALLKNSTVKCWGENEDGQIGDGTFRSRVKPTFVNGLRKVRQISAGASSTCAVLRSGPVKCWGDSEASRPRTKKALGRAKQVVNSASITCALGARGRVRCLRENSVKAIVISGLKSPTGLIGNPSSESSRTKVCAKLRDLTVACWGRSNKAKRVSGLGRTSRIALGGNAFCAVLPDRTARCHGSNRNGQLGDGTVTDEIRKRPTPVIRVPALIEIALGSEHTCAVTADLAVLCWGYLTYGRLGEGGHDFLPVVDLPNPVQIDAGSQSACALLADTTVRCWGSNRSGQLGDGSTVDSHFAKPVAGLVGAKQVSVGSEHACAALVDGSVRCWGNNRSGQIGDDTGLTRLIPVSPIGLSNVVTTASGGLHTCAQLADGTARCWGENYAGQLGDGTTDSSFVPVSVSGLTNVRELSAGYAHSCSAHDDGAISCWGANGHGQLGNGTVVTSPVPGVVPGVADVGHVSAGGNTTCVTIISGAPMCWGSNESGELANGTVGGYTPHPASIPSLSGASVIDQRPGSYGESNTLCVVSSARAVLCWGDDEWDRLGNGALPPNFDAPKRATSAVPVHASVPHDAVGVAVGSDFTCGLFANATTRCWGNNGSGQLGNGIGNSHAFVPLQAVGLTVAKS